jgi:hypothetical protein
MSFSTADLVAALSGGRSFREKSLPESSDFATWLSSPTQQSLMAGLIDITKDELIKKALTDQALMKGKLYG